MKSISIILAVFGIAISALRGQSPIPFQQYDDACGTRGLTRTFPNATEGTNANVPSARLPLFDWTTDSWGSFNQTGLPSQIIHNPFKNIAGTSNFFPYLDYL